jgi:plastocyanin
MEENNQKKPTVLYVVIGILLILLLVAVFILGRNSNKDVDNKNETPSDIVEEEKEVPARDEEGTDLSKEEIAKIDLVKSSRIEVEGADLITPDNKVINSEGDEVRTDVSPTESGAPKQTDPVIREELPENVIDLEVSLGEFRPNTFTVSPGEPITISLTSTDSFGHTLVFRDPLLKAVGIGVGGGETRAITFKAPEIPGQYDFYCNSGGDKVGHVVRGEMGKMIVE